jgi:DNA-directed RNA polymerase specialized sigma24 family protein
MLRQSSYRDKAAASQIVNFYVEGLSAREIAASMGCGKSTVLRRLHELGISVRSKGDSAHRRRRKRITPHRPDILDNVLVDLYRKGLSTITIARQLGCHATTVFRRLKSAGTKLRPVGFFGPKFSTLQIVSLYIEGLTAEEIAARLGCGRSTVKGRLHRAGISRRSLLH